MKFSAPSRQQDIRKENKQLRLQKRQVQLLYLGRRIQWKRPARCSFLHPPSHKAALSGLSGERRDIYGLVVGDSAYMDDNCSGLWQGGNRPHFLGVGLHKRAFARSYIAKANRAGDRVQRRRHGSIALYGGIAGSPSVVRAFL